MEVIACVLLKTGDERELENRIIENMVRANRKSRSKRGYEESTVYGFLRFVSLKILREVIKK